MTTTPQAAHVAVLEALLERAYDDLRMAQGIAEAEGPRARIAALDAAIAAMKQSGDWVLVPRKLTEPMIQAFGDAPSDYDRAPGIAACLGSHDRRRPDRGKPMSRPIDITKSSAKWPTADASVSGPMQNDAALTASPQAAPEGGVKMTFGEGLVLVFTGTCDGQPAVLLYEAPQPGTVGASAPSDGLPDVALYSLTFPTKEQAQRVADALVNAASPQRGPEVPLCNDPMCDQVLTERDHAEAMADKLAYAIGHHFKQDVGEHSNLNCPWHEALEVIENADATASPQVQGGGARHEWDASGERCVRCGDKDWMGGPCLPNPHAAWHAWLTSDAARGLATEPRACFNAGYVAGFNQRATPQRAPGVDELAPLAFWWRCIEAGRQIGGDPPLADNYVILHYCANGVTAMVTSGQLRALASGPGVKGKYAGRLSSVDEFLADRDYDAAAQDQGEGK